MNLVSLALSLVLIAIGILVIKYKIYISRNLLTNFELNNQKYKNKSINLKGINKIISWLVMRPQSQFHDSNSIRLILNLIGVLTILLGTSILIISMQ
jgi:hypothetical protein